MATANGAVLPAADSDQRMATDTIDTIDSTKRKRDEEEGEIAVSGHPFPASKRKQAQVDILEILRQHDTQPSFLEHEIDTDDQPSPKKAKLSAATKGGNTIRSKLEAGAYSSLTGLQHDAESASRGILDTIRAAAKDREGLQVGRLTVDDLKQMQRVRYLVQTVEEFVEQDKKAHEAHAHVVKADNSQATNGELEDTKSNAHRRGNTVLTLFGNGPTPRQLFSSRQHATSDQSDPAMETELPIEELGLPNGLTATTITASSKTDDTPGPTFEDAFPPPYNLPALQPPKPIRRPITRDSNIIWEFKDAWSKPNRKAGYTVQPLTVGDWLSYGGMDPKEDTASVQEKRKLRERALSSGETALPPPSRASREESLAREEEALFRRAYSSFAPSYDNSRALVAEETKNMVWWHKVGRKRFDEVFAIDPALVDEKPMNNLAGVFKLPTTESKQITDEDLGRAVEEFDGLGDDVLGHENHTVRDKTDVDNVLREISELLETLSSHQRIRHASLPPPPAARTSISPAPILASRVGRPDSPAEDEVATYQALRREIAYLVLKLPPYAVAKLDGDQLSDLGVSRLLPFESKNIKGTMEEDQVSRQARQTAMATAAGIASLTRSQSSSSGQHYSSTNQRAPAIGQAANTRYGGQYGVSRTPLNGPQFQRSSSNQSSYNTPTAAGQRPGYSTSVYNAQTGQPRQGYTPQTGQQYYQRPAQPATGGYAGYPQQYQSTPNTQQRPTYSSQPLAQFQNQHAQNAARYQSQQYGSQQQQQQPQQAATPFNRTMSPAKYTTQNPQPIAQRPSFSTQLPPQEQQQQQQQQQQAGSDRATPNSYPSQPHTPVNGIQRPPSQGPQQAVSATPQPSVEGQQAQVNGHQ